MSRVLGAAIALIAGLSAAAPLPCAGADGDHLLPRSESALFGYRADPYDPVYRRELLPGVEHSTVAAVALPSFSREWAILLHPSKNGEALLEMRIAKGRLFAAGSKAPARGFSTHRDSLPARTADAITNAWKTQLLRTRYAEPDPNLVRLDGATYHFASYEIHEYGPRFMMEGETWSPPHCSPTGMLVDLLYELRRFAVLRAPASLPESEIRDRALALTDSARLDRAIAECKAKEAAEAAVDEQLRGAAQDLAELGEWQYCLCGRWPTSAAELRFFDERITASENKVPSDIGPLESTLMPGFDLETARLSLDARGQLRVSLPGYDYTARVPECLELPKSRGDELLGPDHCPPKQ